MRISDWSSDVCSSDLNGCQRRDNALTFEQLAHGCLDPVLTEQLHVLDLRQAAGCAEQLVFAVEQVKQGQIGRAHAELQSLMRISYAVFCLKNKNNQTKLNSVIKRSHTITT